MKKTKKTLILLLVFLLAFNTFLIGASAYVEGLDLLGVDINLEVGRYSGNEFTALTPGEALYAEDIITVRIAPTTDFLVGITRYAVMFTKDYLEVVGSGKMAFSPNEANPFYATACDGYAGTTNIPQRAWPPAMLADGTSVTNTVIAVNTSCSASYSPNGGYPGYLTGEWLFRFDLKVTQDITAGSGAKVWMDDQWTRKPGFQGQTYFTKCLNSEEYSTKGSSANYYFNVDLAGANINLEPTAVSEETAITVTKTEDNMLVDIAGWSATDQYQIWSYQQVTSDLLLDAESNAKANQWILSKAYAPGSAGAVQGDGSIRFTVPNFISPTANYLMAVRVADASGNFIQELRGAFTPEDVGEVVINEIIVDDVVTTGYELREIKYEAETVIKVIGNDVPGIVYSAKAIYGPELILIADSINTNEFHWNISALKPGIYTIEITATGGSTATQEIIFELFSLAGTTTYASIDEMTLGLITGGVEITPTFANGTFTYKVREPGRSASFGSIGYTNAGSIEHTITAPGVYHVYGYATRAGLIGTESGGYDDGLIRTLVIPRDGGSGSASLDFTANQTLPDVANGTPIVFTATATGLPGTVQYSFWRYDATGYVLVKDWSTSNTFSWTPARLGEYQLEARAKGDGAGSYELKTSLGVNITDQNFAKADVTTITLNSGELAAAQAKKPIMLKAAATGIDKDELLYKFFVYDDDMLNQQLKGYSVDQHCVWTPREAGTYTIIVLVKNQYSFGKFDAIEHFEVTAS